MWDLLSGLFPKKKNSNNNKSSDSDGCFFFLAINLEVKYRGLSISKLTEAILFKEYEQQNQSYQGYYY